MRQASVLNSEDCNFKSSSRTTTTVNNMKGVKKDLGKNTLNKNFNSLQQEKVFNLTPQHDYVNSEISMFKSSAPLE